MIKQTAFLLGLILAAPCRAEIEAAHTKPDQGTIKEYFNTNMNSAAYECSTSLAFLAWKRVQAETPQEKALLDGLSANEFKRCTGKYTPATIYGENSKFAGGFRDGLQTAAKAAYLENNAAKAQELTTMANQWDAIATDFSKKAEAHKAPVK